MNREDIIRMARSAIRLAAKDTDLTNFDQEATILDRYEFLYWFAKEAAAAEREACIELTDSRCQCGGLIQSRGQQ